MNAQQFRKSIMESFNCLKELALTDWDRFPNQKSLSVNAKFQTIALDSKSRYEEIYKVGLSQFHYNFLLDDYSYFQFTIDSVHSNINSLRYAYYSNPYKLPSNFNSFAKDMISEGEVFALGELYLQEFDEAELYILNPPIRYDYDPKSYAEARHPAGHIHIGVFQGGRISVRRVLSPLTFVLFIAKNYYPDKWILHENNDSRENGFINKLDHYLAKSKNNCPLVERNLFSTNEELLPYLD